MTAIEWTDETWNPVTGCSHVSEGCRNCYAENISLRYKRSSKPWTAQNAAENVKLQPERLERPLGWREPRMVFVNSMSDLFHELVPFEFIDKVFAVMGAAPRHVFQVLTKRHARMRAYMETCGHAAYNARRIETEVYPPPNVWLGVSVETQKNADERIPLLLETPAAVRFLSCEPLLGPIDLRHLPFTSGDPRHKQDALTGQPLMFGSGVDGHPDMIVRITQPSFPSIDWVIAGGESQPGCRPMDLDWARSLRDQCVAAGVPFFLKQLGGFPNKRGKDQAVLDGERWTRMPAVGARV